MSETITLRIRLSPDDLRRIQSQVDHIDDKPLHLTAQFPKQASKDVGDFDAGLKGLLPSITKVGGAMAVIGAATGFVAKGVSNFVDLDKELRNIGSLGVENFQEFGDVALEMSKRIPESAVNIAKGVYQAISAGVDSKAAAGFVETAAKAATAGLSDTETAVNALSSVLNAYKLSAGQAETVSDQMFTAVKNGKTTFNEINAAIANVVPIAASAGVGFDQVAAGIASMTKQGVPTTQASTQMRQAIVEILKPGKELETVMRQAGIESGATALKMYGLQGTLDRLEKAASANGKTMTQVFSSVEAGSAALSLAGENAALAAADLDAMKNSAGAMGDAFDVNANSVANRMQILTNKVDALATKTAEALLPVFEAILPVVEDVIDAIDTLFNGLEEHRKKLATRLQDEETQSRIKREQAYVKAALEISGARYEDELQQFHGMTRDQLNAWRKSHGLMSDVSDEQFKRFREAFLFAVTVPTNFPDLAEQILEPFRRPKEEIDKTKKGTEGLVVSLESLRAKLKELEEQRSKTSIFSKQFFSLPVAISDLKNNIDLLESGVLAQYGNSYTKLKEYIERRSVGEVIARGFGLDDSAKAKIYEQLEVLRISLQNATNPENAERLEKAIDSLLDKLNELGDKRDLVAKVETKDAEEKFSSYKAKLFADLDEIAKQAQEGGTLVGQLFGDALVAGLSDGRESFRDILRGYLGDLAEYVIRVGALRALEATLNELGTKGFLGIFTAAAITGLITGLAAGAKKVITGFATGGVIVGERGPEVIAPAKEFSEFAGVIVKSALQAIRIAVAKMNQAERASVASIRTRISADPVELRFSGRDARALLKFHDLKEEKNVIGNLS